MDMLGQTEAPSTSIDVCLPDGFILNSGVRIDGGAGALLVGGEAFEWRPWEAAAAGEGKGEMKLVNKKGQWELQNPEEAFGLLGMVWPRPGMWFSFLFFCLSVLALSMPFMGIVAAGVFCRFFPLSHSLPYSVF